MPDLLLWLLCDWTLSFALLRVRPCFEQCRGDRLTVTGSLRVCVLELMLIPVQFFAGVVVYVDGNTHVTPSHIYVVVLP